jgi:hypothetical protein
MTTTFRTTCLVFAVGMFGVGAGWMAAQGTSAGTLSGQVTTATANVAAAADNGALPGDSHVRIVRLSEVSGKMALDRMTGKGFEATMQNMPIVQGERLQTSDGYAEVEFEDNGTLRLAPESRVDFPLLALRSSGAKASTMRVVRGTVYVTTENTKDNEFLLQAGATKITVAPSTHLRLDVNESRTVVSVFGGSAAVVQGAETTVVAKKESLTLGAEQPTIAKKITEEPFDAWDKQSNDYHQQYSKANTFAGGGNSFGLSDLNYYGNFINAGGCGQVWQPYLVSASWSPYANGVWALYPGAGYSWVSPYPWGWLPYHSGSWSFCQGVGWGWQPGGAWNGLNNIASAAGTPGTSQAGTRPVHSPLRPAAEMPQPPATAAGSARPSLVLSNATPIVFSKEDKPGNFVFQQNSAGLGVPRGSLGNLSKISSNVGRNGSASMPVSVSTRGETEGSEHGASRGPVTIQRSSGEGERGSSVSSASRGGGFEGSHGADAAGARGGGMSSPAGGGGSMGGGGASGGAKGSSSSPK